VLTGSSTPRARLTLALAVAGSAALLTATVLYLRHETQPDPEPTVAASPAGPWEPPSAPATTATPPSTAPASPAGPSTTSASAKPTTPASSRPPATRTTEPTTAPTPTPGPNLSLTAGSDADGSSKAGGTSFNNVRDGGLATFWSPDGGTTGRVSVKRTTPLTVARVIIREAPGGGEVQSWRLVNHDNDKVLATGSRAGVITFPQTTLSKIDFVIVRAGGVPRIAEFETYTA
jgi:hypothetical protein